MTEHQEKKIKFWTDEAGNYFPWVEELFALQAQRGAESAARGGSDFRPVSEMPLPKLSFLVNCMTAIKSRPELMSKIRDIAQRYPTPEQVPQGESRDLGNFISMFLSWLELKNGQEHFGLARASLYRILYNMEIGNFRGSEADLIRQENPKGSFIDDLA
jgi:hypothetical protein